MDKDKFLTQCLTGLGLEVKTANSWLSLVQLLMIVSQEKTRKNVVHEIRCFGQGADNES
jgi:hypothetical protein